MKLLAETIRHLFNLKRGCGRLDRVVAIHASSNCDGVNSIFSCGYLELA